MNEMGDISKDVVSITEGLLNDLTKRIHEDQAFRIPIDELTILGTGTTVTDMQDIHEGSFYRMAESCNVLSSVEDGDCWESIRRQDSRSKMAKFQEFEGSECVGTRALPVNAAVIMGASVLQSVERELPNIERICRGIELFLEAEKEDEIKEAVEELLLVVKEFKNNWNNETFVMDHYQPVVAIQKKAKSKIIAFQRQVVDPLNSNKILTSRAQIEELLAKILKNFKYYRMDLFIFSMASYLEILLTGSFEKEYINSIKVKVEDNSHKYRSILKRCTDELDKNTMKSVRTNLIKETKLDGTVPEGQNHLRSGVYDIEKETLKAFSEISNPGTLIFINMMKDIIRIYNDTTEVCFDNKNFYLL